MAPSPQTVIALVSLTISAASIVAAVRARAHRIRAEASAARAIRISREQRITQHLESSGGCARLVVDDRDVEVHVRAGGDPAWIAAGISQALRKYRRGES